MSELQAALETSIFVDIALPTEERRHQAKVVATLKEAARLVANSPTYKWCEVHHSGVNWRTGADIMQGVERCDAHRLLTMPGQEATVAACDVIAAALTPPGDTETDRRTP